MASNFIQIPAYGAAAWKDPVATVTDLPANGNTTGDARVTQDTSIIYVWSGSAWVAAGGGGGGIASINADSTSAQLLAVGTAGTNFAIVDNGTGTHTFNLPTASASNRGALSSTDWSTFNGKQAAGNYITALTGDGAASGPGSAAFTLATVNSNVGSFTNASITVDAKGRITAASTGTGGGVTTMGAFGSTPNANGASISGVTLTLQPADGTNPGGVSTTTQTIAGAKTFSSVVSIPAGAVNAVSLHAGTVGTGIWFPTAASVMAFSSGGAEVWRTNASGITIGNTTGQTKALYIKPATGTLGIQIENANNTRKFNIDATAAGNTLFGMDGTNGMFLVSNVATGGTGVNWWSMGGNGTASPPAWPMGFECVSADGSVTSITATSFTPLAGASVNSSPIVVLRNRSSTVNSLAIWGTTGSSGNLMSMIGSRHVVQTASSEDSEVLFCNRKAGTMIESLTINKNGQTIIQQAGAGLSVKTGSNCKMGKSTMVAGTVTVSTTAVTASSHIFLTSNVAGGTQGELSVGTVTAGTSFIINSSSALDTSTVAWFIVEPS